jgi:CRISPR-associated protein Cmr4
MAVSLLFVHALTSIHPGTGQGVGTIDLPVARERATNLPVIPGSTLKGCLRANGRIQDDRKEEIYGTRDAQGKFRVSDARLLLLPVRSAGSTFAWTTSPYVLRRLQRDCALLTGAAPPERIPEPRNDLDACMEDKTAAVAVGGQPRLVLEDFDFEIRTEDAQPWAEWLATRLFAGDDSWQKQFRKRFAVINDANFDYLCEFATEVNAHIEIGEKGVVKSKALWYEETLPAETVLVSLIDTGDTAASELVPEYLRLGGNETTGQGLARLVVQGG